MRKVMVMKIGRPLILFVSAGLLFLAGCTPRDIQSLEGRILFSVKESYREMEVGTEPSPYLSMETEKIYGCFNVSIVSGLRRSDARLNVDIEGIETPEICLTAFGPARGFNFLDLEDGDYSLEFRYGPLFRSAYELSISSEAITVAEASGGGGLFTKPKFTIWWRYPLNSFAVICGTTTGTSWAFEDFLGRLRSGVDLTPHEFPAYGEIGYPRAWEGAQVNHPARYFLYESEADFAEAGEVLREYARNVIGGMTGVHIWILNWKYESFRSWTIGPQP